jgi:ABC-type lipoprotein release transport system permease subunit
MNSILKIALRNVGAHKIKTGIVGGLIFLGVFLIVVGNSFLSSTTESLRRAYTQSVSAEIAVIKKIDFDYSLFGTWNEMGNLHVPKLPDYDRTLEFLQAREEVREITTVSQGFLIVNAGENDSDFWLNGLAVDPESYGRVFNVDESLILHEGRMLLPDEEGIVLSKYAADYLRDYKDITVHPGDSLLLNGYSANGFRIREVPVRGIFEYRYVKGDMYPMLPRTCLMDQQNLNLLCGLNPPPQKEETSALAEELLFTPSEEDMFGEVSFDGEVSADPVETDLSALLGDMSLRHQLSQTENSDWQWFLVSLKEGDKKSVKAFREKLEDNFSNAFQTFTPDYVSDAPRFAGQFLTSEQEEIAYLRTTLTEDEKSRLENARTGSEDGADQISLIINRLMGIEGLQKDSPLESYPFDTMTRNLMDEKPDESVTRRLNRLMIEELFPYTLEKGPDYTVSEWWHAAAPMSMTTMGIQAVMNAALIILFIVAVIIIMNTLIISVMERTGEIGTMRAMGAGKGFVFLMFLAETLVISLIFGLSGMIAGSLVITLIGSAGIPAAEGTMLQMIAGGNTLYPALSGWALGAGFLFMILTALLSILYPVGFALQIQPVEAMREE